MARRPSPSNESCQPGGLPRDFPDVPAFTTLCLSFPVSPVGIIGPATAVIQSEKN